MTAVVIHVADREHREAGARNNPASRQALRLRLPQIDVETASRDKLIAHIDELEFIISDLMPKEGDAHKARVRLGLTPTEAGIVSCLMAGGIKSRQQLRRSTYQWGDVGDVKTIEVVICRLRKKLALHGISIKTAWGQGYIIDGDSLTRLRSILDAEG